MKVVYISGPMGGIESHNFPAFNCAAHKWRSLGYAVLNPAELRDVGMPDKDSPESWDAYLRRDVKMLMDADMIAVLPGWSKSKGARLEVTIGRLFGMPILDTDTGEVISNFPGI
jgi:hypothetical protein